MPALVFHPPFALRRRHGQVTPPPSAVLLVVPDRQLEKDAARGAPVPAAVRQAARLAAAEGGTVTVVTTVRIHGSALGAPHPGLLPTERERDQGRRAVAAAVAALEKLGTSANGHILVTRAPGRAIAQTARARGARTVLVALPEPRGLRGLLEGNLAAQLRRRLRDSATIETVGGGSD